MKNMNLDKLNVDFRDQSPEKMIEQALKLAEKPIITTNFRPYEAAILHAVTAVAPGIEVVWCDTGYNTTQTYQHAETLIQQLNLNIQLYVPAQTVAYREVAMGIPALDDPQHARFTEQVKLEPFARAMAAHAPDLWFTNLRQGQTRVRDQLDLFSQTPSGLIKACPFYYWTDAQLDGYLAAHKLPNEFNYFDPTKQLDNRECGLHTSSSL